MTHADYVADDEVLYRRVPATSLAFMRLDDGTVKLSASAFADRHRRASVDRAKLRNNDPHATQSIPSDGVVSLVAEEVRSIRESTRDSKGRTVQEHLVDVEPVPLDDNPAHAEIFVTPEVKSKRTVERINASLATRARWVIRPHSA